MRGEYLLSAFPGLGPAASRFAAHANFASNRNASSTLAGRTCVGTTAHGTTAGRTICAVCMLGQDLDLSMKFCAFSKSPHDLDPNMNFRAPSMTLDTERMRCTTSA